MIGSGKTVPREILQASTPRFNGIRDFIRSPRRIAMREHLGIRAVTMKENGGETLFMDYYRHNGI